MNDKMEIPPNHKRTLSAMAHDIESDLFDIKKLLQNNDDIMITENILRTINVDKAKNLLDLIEEMLKANSEMFFDLELDPTENIDTKIIKSKIAYLWSVIVDHTASSLERYGKLDPPEAELVDKHINRLSEIVKKLRSLNLD